MARPLAGALRRAVTRARARARRYASLFFVMSVKSEENELLTLETIHHFVEVLDRYFGNVCELDIIFNFHKAFYIVDEMLVAGRLCEPSKREVLRACAAEDELMDDARERKGKSGR